jgi:glutamate synthase (NADPH/NADH) small chain
MVIGGRLTAVDAALTPLMYKDDFKVEKVMLSYRRTRREAPMGERGFRELEENGVETLELTAPIEFIGEKRLEAVKLVRMKLIEDPGARRPKPVPIEGSEFEVNVDYVLIAAGLVPTPPFKGECCGIKLNPDGTIKTDEKYRTTRKKVFAAGDVRHGASLIGPALRSGVEAAKYVHEFLVDGKW